MSSEYKWIVTRTSKTPIGWYIQYDVYYLDDNDDKQIILADHVEMEGAKLSPEDVRTVINEKVAAYAKTKASSKAMDDKLKGLKG